MYAFADRVKETSATTGTGTFSLAGAVSGFRGFVAAGLGGLDCYYVAESGTSWEIGIGHLTDATPDTLSRTTVIASSNSNELVSFTGTVTIYSAPLTRMFRRTGMASENPEVTDDSAHGFVEGDILFTNYNGANICLSAEVGNAVWLPFLNFFKTYFELSTPTTTDATPISLENDILYGVTGITAAFHLVDDWINAFTIFVEAFEDSTGDGKVWELKGAIKMVAGTPTIVGTVTKTVLGAAAGASSWDVSVIAGTSGLEVVVTGEAGKSINWFARGRL